MRHIITGGLIGVALLVNASSGLAATDGEHGDTHGDHHHMGMMDSHDQQQGDAQQSQQASDTVYVCPMHPEIRKAEPGRCPICGMNLEPQPVEPTKEGAEQESSESHQSSDASTETPSSGHQHSGSSTGMPSSDHHH